MSTQAAPPTPAGKIEAPLKVPPEIRPVGLFIKDASGTTICQRPAPMGKAGGVYAEKATKGRSCRWKCTMEQGVEVCERERE